MKLNDINEPLSEREEGEYFRLEEKLESGGELTFSEYERYDDLALREARLSDLEKFRELSEGIAFGPFSEYNWDKFEVSHFRAKVQRYEHFKKQCKTISSRLALIHKERERQPDLKKEAEAKANLYYGGHDKTKEAIKIDVIQRVYDEFERYLQLEEKMLQQATPAPTVLDDAGPTPLKTMRQVVLLHIYQNALIPHAQASLIAKKHGFSSPTSGQKLYSTYNKLASHSTARTGVGPHGLRSMIADIQAVVPYLAEDGRKQAERELQTLKAAE